MSKQNLISFLQSTEDDEQLSAQLHKRVNYEDFKAIAKDRGFDLGNLSAEEARRTIQIVTGQVTEELTADELELVSAGAAKVYGDIDGFKQESQGKFYEGWPRKFYEGWPCKW